MMVTLSARLLAVGSLVKAGGVLADVGTDHGYVPIYLLEKKQISRAIAMDINKGPLERAKEHIRLFQMENYIETRRSDGVSALMEGEADSILIAGMGGGLMIHILEEGKAVCKGVKELILQPQSEAERLRRYLAENGYRITDEDIVSEEGKFYPMMRISPLQTVISEQSADGCINRMGAKINFSKNEAEQRICYRYGGLLLKDRHPVLKEFLLKERAQLEKIKKRVLSEPESARLVQRREELSEQIDTNRRALAYYEETSAD